jgi:spore germination cell wall hydrolase CwlJ-like protein
MNKLIEQSTWLAINIYHEARGEPLEGKIAVAHVTLNRLRKERKPVKEVILRPFQFSWANSKHPPIRDYAAFIECQKAAMLCFEERLEGKDLFKVDHYYNPDKANPSWANKMTEIAVIGNHRFMRDDPH